MCCFLSLPCISLLLFLFSSSPITVTRHPPTPLSLSLTHTHTHTHCHLLWNIKHTQEQMHRARPRKCIPLTSCDAAAYSVAEFTQCPFHTTAQQAGPSQTFIHLASMTLLKAILYLFIIYLFFGLLHHLGMNKKREILTWSRSNQSWSAVHTAITLTVCCWCIPTLSLTHDFIAPSSQ